MGLSDCIQMDSKHDRSDKIKIANEATFSHLVLDGKGPVVVEFMSYGCGFCRSIEPILQQVADNLRSTQKFFRVNVPSRQAWQPLMELMVLLHLSCF